MAAQQEPDDETENAKGWLPMFWTPDGHNYIPTSGKAWALLAGGAIGLALLIKWLS
ncbi:hypothetical protein [Leucobacter tenebrionis]|uniref:hypothetical protein n=1 Tax=Leucobacter tenebrionis TaxID=2873270 RepID=UPI001CA74BBC|nr:hypothetical protein [Leucobacter tenebrionis]QZY52380.1 hypothetical protein KVY00_02625 [Leucobacter tenebrionis]